VQTFWNDAALARPGKLFKIASHPTLLGSLNSKIKTRSFLMKIYAKTEDTEDAGPKPRIGCYEVQIPEGTWDFFLFFQMSRTVLGPTGILFIVSFSEAKRRGLEVDRSPLSNAEMKNKWSYTSTPRTLPFFILFFWGGGRFRKFAKSDY